VLVNTEMRRETTGFVDARDDLSARTHASDVAL
jgi:hypothetical protein